MNDNGKTKEEFLNELTFLRRRIAEFEKAESECKRTEGELKAAKAQLSNALEMAHLGHWEFDVANDLFTFNDQFYKIFRATVDQVGGYAMHSAEYAHRFVHPDDFHMVGEEIRKALETTDPHFTRTIEHRMLFSDGTVGYISVRFFIVKDSQGRTIKTYGVNQDITERKRAEEATHQSEAMFRTLFMSMKEGFYLSEAIYDHNGNPCDYRYLEVNPRFEQIMGLSRDQIIGKRYKELVPVDSTQWLDNYFTVARSGEPCSYEFYSNEYHMYFDTYAYQPAKGQVCVLVRNITEQKLANEALKRSEEEYRELVENANSIILRMNNIGVVTFINEFAQRFFGYSEQEIIGKNVVSTILPPIETAGRDLQVMIDDIALNPDRYASSIIENMRRGGERVWIAWTNKPIRYENGRVVEVLCVGNDITERKQAEETLKRANLLMSTQKETSIEGILAVDESGTIISSNRRFSDMWGIPPELMEGQHHVPALQAILDRVKDPQLSLRRVEYLYGDRNITSLEEIALKDGRTFERYTAPMNGADGKYYGRVWYFRDITERKAMEKAVAEAEAKYRDIFENSVAGIYQTTLDGRILSINTSIAHMLGYDSVEEASEALSDLRQLYVNPERRSEMARLVERHGLAKEFEAEFYRKDRSTLWVALNIRAVRDETGEIAYLEGTASDITERKLLKAQLDHAQKMEAIGTLAGGIAHDFNNILAPIIGYTELSLNMAPEDGRLSHNMRQVLLSANRAKDLVRQILSFSRKTEQENKLVQVSLIVKEVLKLLRSSLPSTIEIRQAISPDALHSITMADPTRIHQVLMNLCTNAAHAMRAAGGTLRVSLQNVEIGPKGARGAPNLEPGPHVKLSVADTGHGMDTAVQQRIFDPYFTTKGPEEGTGLGLAVVYGIVKNLSGAILVKSESGKGATFDVFFPRIETGPEASAMQSVSLPTGRGVVLVVDDEKHIVDMMKDMLVSLGYEAVSRYSSSDALEVFKAKPGSFDIVITDLTMPHMTGIDLAREILKVRAGTPIILCTGFSEAVDENRAKLTGIKELLMKPVSMRDLAVAVNRLLGRDSLPSSTFF
jgi:PAS domain S-box-containing protein